MELEYGASELADHAGREDLALDSRLLTAWHAAMRAGSFRYRLDSRKERQLAGRFCLLAQYQPCRATLRRPPQAMLSLRQLPHPDGFNFTKVDEARELLLSLSNRDRPGPERTVLLINVSPIDPGHSLLVPCLEARLPQLLTRQAVAAALELLALSSSPDIRLAFNSLCAYASVNHLHWHVYYQPHRSAVTSVPLQRVAGPVLTWAAEDYPAQGWCLLLPPAPAPARLALAAEHLVRLTDWLVEREVAHNVFLCPGGGPGEPGRLLVWPRESVRGAKDPGAFVMAVCELSGQVLVYDEETYENITEEEVQEAQVAATARLHSLLTPQLGGIFPTEDGDSG